MMKSLAIAAVAITGAAAQVNRYTATSASAVYAAQATAKTSHETSKVPGKAFDRFITIWLENTDFDMAAADPNLKWLAKQGLTLTNYFGVTHPSQPNYVASHGGDNFGMDNDDFTQIASNVSTVTDLLEAKGISWASYEEAMPFTGYEGFDWVNQTSLANDYVRKHNPPVIYDANTTPKRLTYQKNFTLFYEDLAAEKLPQWMFITPNMTDDGHDTSVTFAGEWLRGFIAPLIENEYFWNNTLILLTFDEVETYTIRNNVFSILFGGAVPKDLVGTKDHKYYNHYSEISTVEANWDLNTLGRWDVGANVFGFVAEKTGDIYRANHGVMGDHPTHFYNSSFAGPFNVDFKQAPFPAPNLNIKSPKTGRTVLPSIKEKWAGSSLPTYYTDGVEVYDGGNPPPGYAVNQ